MIDLLQGHDPFVAFVGAGASVLPPSNLPRRTEFNDLLLESLCESVADYSQNRQPSEEMLNLFRQRRDETRFMAPDFQAQLVEEEIGADYFNVWQSLKTDVYGPVHAGLTELASRGMPAAIVTTNFDQLLENALDARDQDFRVFHDRTTFDELVTIAEGTHTDALPVIKIHGSIEDTSSLVDTLRQRLVGRPEPLMKTLQFLLRRHPWLYLGFSGADFSYDAHYLGILDAAADAKGFVFLAPKGRKIQDGVMDGVGVLAHAYGPDKAVIIHGDLPEWLYEAFDLATPSPVPVAANSGNDNQLGVRNRIREWAKKLGPIAVVNILCSMLRSSGMEGDAFWLLRKTWKSYRSSRDTKGKSYDRYNYNYGISLLEAGLISNPIALAEDMNAFEYLARSYTTGKLLAAGGALASVLAYRGEVSSAIELAKKVIAEARAGNAPLDLCDVALASAPIYDILQIFRPAVEAFRHCLKIAQDLGDEPRRAMLCAHLGRFLTYGGHYDEADAFISEVDRIGRRLDLRAVLLASQARGLWFADSKTSVESAVGTLQDVAVTIHSLDDVSLFSKIDILKSESAPVLIKGRHPILCRVLLDLNRAALFAGDTQVMNQTLDELDELATEVFPGYCPHYYLSYAQCLLIRGDGHQQELMADLIRRARRMGELSGNPWVAKAADDLQRQIGNAP